MKKKLTGMTLSLLLAGSTLLTGCASLSVDSYIKNPGNKGPKQTTEASEAQVEQNTQSESETEPQKLPEIRSMVDLVPVTVSASSTLQPDNSGNIYEPRNATDNNLKTCWAEGAEDEGVGQYLELAYPIGTEITGGVIYPAYYKSKKLFERNPAINSFVISSGKQSCYIDCSEATKKYSSSYEGFSFTLDSPITCDGKVRIEIKEVRSGSKYKDCSISEIHLRGYAVGESADSQDTAADTEESSAAELPPEISEQSDLERIASGAGSLIRFTTGDKLSENGVKIKASTMTSEEKSFLLYHYQYFNDKLPEAGGGEFHTASRDEIRDWMIALVEGGSTKDADYFLKHYTEKESGGKYYMSAVGDFGDAGEFYFANAVSGGIEDGEMIVKGDVMEYNSKKKKYKATRKFTIYLVAEEDGIFGGWKYHEITVSKKK